MTGSPLADAPRVAATKGSSPLRPVWESLSLLTAIPMGKAARPGPVSPWVTAWFPVVGVALGGLLYLTWSIPIGPTPRAALVLALWVALTGGLHEDGWIDCADAALAPASRQRRLEILKDPRAGAHGVTAVTLLLIMRFAVLIVVPSVALLVAPVVGRWAMACSLAWARPVRATGLGARYAAAGVRGVAPSIVSIGILSAIALSVAPAATVAWAVAAGGVVGFLVAFFLSGRFGGLTGDGHGAVGLASELAALAMFVPLAGMR